MQQDKCAILVWYAMMTQSAADAAGNGKYDVAHKGSAKGSLSSPPASAGGGGFGAVYRANPPLGQYKLKQLLNPPAY
jgi:hypothetical protein